MLTIDAPCLPIGPRFGGDDDGDEILEAEYSRHGQTYIVRFWGTEVEAAIDYLWDRYQRRDLNGFTMVRLGQAIHEACGDVCVPGIGWVDG